MLNVAVNIMSSLLKGSKTNSVISLIMARSKASSWIWDYFNKDNDEPMIAVWSVCITYKWFGSKNSSTAYKFLSFILYIFLHSDRMVFCLLSSDGQQLSELSIVYRA